MEANKHPCYEPCRQRLSDGYRNNISHRSKIRKRDPAPFQIMITPQANGIVRKANIVNPKPNDRDVSIPKGVVRYVVTMSTQGMYTTI